MSDATKNFAEPGRYGGRDSMSEKRSRMEARMAQEIESLRGRVKELEAELERVRHAWSLDRDDLRNLREGQHE